MRVLKVTLEGITASFRYPHFMFDVQPTFPMPPPATIYGHICSALGDWVDPKGISFAYHFTAQSAFVDLEHVHLLSGAGGKLPETQHPQSLKGGILPFHRHILFQPRMVLYLNHPEWEDAFRSPTYPVVLGRSQDLCTYTAIETVELVEREAVYLEHTLLPFDMATQTQVGVVTLMPRYLDYEHNRRPTFARYLVLQRSISTEHDFVRFGDVVPRFWSDPTAPEKHGLPLGLVFHTFTGAEHEALTVAGLS